MAKWSYKIQKVYKTPGKAAVQVRFSDGVNFFFKTYPVESASQLESIDLACVDELARIEELYRKVDDLQKE